MLVQATIKQGSPGCPATGRLLCFVSLLFVNSLTHGHWVECPYNTYNKKPLRRMITESMGSVFLELANVTRDPIWWRIPLKTDFFTLFIYKIWRKLANWQSRRFHLCSDRRVNVAIPTQNSQPIRVTFRCALYPYDISKVYISLIRLELAKHKTHQ